MTAADVLEEFITVQKLRGYSQPKNLSDIEHCYTDEEYYMEEDSKCAVDIFFRKEKGLR